MEKPSANDGYLPEGQNFRQHCMKYFKYPHHNFYDPLLNAPASSPPWTSEMNLM
jgi:hypothetical protein